MAQKIVIDTVLAWKLVNMCVSGNSATFPKTTLDSEIQDKYGEFLKNKEGCNLMQIFNTLFKEKPCVKYQNAIEIQPRLYKFLRPEIIAQHIQLVSCIDAKAAKMRFGSLIELSEDLKFEHTFS